MDPKPSNWTHFAFKVDLLVEVDELLHPLHGLHAGVTLSDDLSSTTWLLMQANALQLLILILIGTFFSSLKALVAVSSSRDPGAVRFKMF